MTHTRKIRSGREITRKILSAKMLNDLCSSSKSCFPLVHIQISKTCISETCTTLVFPEMINPKHHWCSREPYMKLKVLILCKPRVTSDLYSGKKDLCWSKRGRALLLSSIFYFLSQRFRGAVALWSFSGGHKVIT